MNIKDVQTMCNNFNDVVEREKISKYNNTPNCSPEEKEKLFKEMKMKQAPYKEPETIKLQPIKMNELLELTSKIVECCRNADNCKSCPLSKAIAGKDNSCKFAVAPLEIDYYYVMFLAEQAQIIIDNKEVLKNVL